MFSDFKSLNATQFSGLVYAHNKGVYHEGTPPCDITLMELHRPSHAMKKVVGSNQPTTLNLTEMV